MKGFLKALFPPQLTPHEVKRRFEEDQSIFILDVRDNDEFIKGHLGETKALIPLEELSKRVEELEGFKELEIVVVCTRGVRSKKACRFLLQKGFKKVYNMKGGLAAYQALGYTLKQGMEIEGGGIHRRS